MKYQLPTTISHAHTPPCLYNMLIINFSLNNPRMPSKRVGQVIADKVVAFQIPS